MAPLFTNRVITKQIDDWVERTKDQKESKKKPPVITISREWGSEGSGIAHEIQKKLGKPWQVWDKQIIDEIAKRAEVRKEMVEAVDEKVRTEFEKFLGTFFQSVEISPLNYKEHLVQVLLSIGHYGYAVVLGRGANFILPNSFRVRVVASRKKRIEVLKLHEKVSEEEALILMRNSDNEREKFIQTTFGEDINAPWNYDLSIKTSYIRAKLAADLIVRAAKVKLEF